MNTLHTQLLPRTFVCSSQLTLTSPHGICAGTHQPSYWMAIFYTITFHKGLTATALTSDGRTNSLESSIVFTSIPYLPLLGNLFKMVPSSTSSALTMIFTSMPLIAASWSETIMHT